MGTHLQEPSHCPSPEPCFVLEACLSANHAPILSPSPAFPETPFHTASVPSGGVASGAGFRVRRRAVAGLHFVSGALKCLCLFPEPPKVPDTNDFPLLLYSSAPGTGEYRRHAVTSTLLTCLSGPVQVTFGAPKHGVEWCGDCTGASWGQGGETPEDGEVPD